jgi:hypothetical protein
MQSNRQQTRSANSFPHNPPRLSHSARTSKPRKSAYPLFIPLIHLAYPPHPNRGPNMRDHLIPASKPMALSRGIPSPGAERHGPVRPARQEAAGNARVRRLTLRRESAPSDRDLSP